MPLHLAKSWRSVYIDVFGNTSDLWTHEERGVRNQQLTSFSTLSTSKYCSNQTPHEESAQSDRNGSNDVFGGGGGVRHVGGHVGPHVVRHLIGCRGRHSDRA